MAMPKDEVALPARLASRMVLNLLQMPLVGATNTASIKAVGQNERTE